MAKFLDFLRYLIETFDTGDALNSYLAKLPFEVQEHAVAIGEWIKTLMGWG